MKYRSRPSAPTKVLAVAVLCVAFAGHAASAPTAELAKTCRSLMLKAYPYKLPGLPNGNAAQQRAYFSECIEKQGHMPADVKPK